MIDEKILLDKLKTEYDKLKALYYETDKDPFYAAELSALSECMTIIRQQKKFNVDLDSLMTAGKFRQFPKELLDEWDSVTNNLRKRYKSD